MNVIVKKQQLYLDHQDAVVVDKYFFNGLDNVKTFDSPLLFAFNYNINITRQINYLSIMLVSANLKWLQSTPVTKTITREELWN